MCAYAPCSFSKGKSDHQISVRNGCSQSSALRASFDERTILLVSSCSFHGFCSSRMHVVNLKLLQKRRTRKAGDRDSSFSLSALRVSWMVASPSHMASESSRRSSTSWRGQFVHFAFEGSRQVRFFLARLFFFGVRVFFCFVCISLMGCVTPCLRNRFLKRSFGLRSIGFRSGVDRFS